jgi:cobalt-zinc-cadmium resistance protein CzcA
VPVCKSGGQQVPLGELADIKVEETPPNIEHEATRRRTYVKCDVIGRGVVGFVAEAQEAIRRHVDVSGLILKWGGDFEYFESASLRLAWITPLVLLVVFLLLYTSVGSMKLAALIYLAVPMSASGGVFALAVRGMEFNISAGVGFIALFGVAVLNGLVWVSGAEHMRASGMSPHDASESTALARLRPVVMTAAVASLGFLPMAASTTPGAEIQRPLATVVIGGIITSTLLTTLVLPTIYPWFCPQKSGESVAAWHARSSAGLTT